MRLIDQIRTGCPLGIDVKGFIPGAEWQAFDSSFRRALDDTPVIIADNIDEFFYARHQWLADRDATPEEVNWDGQNPRLVLANEYPNAVPPFPRMWIEWRPSQPVWRNMMERFGVLVTALKRDGNWDMEIVGICQAKGFAGACVSRETIWITADPIGNIQCGQSALMPFSGVESPRNAEPIGWLFAHVPLLAMCFMNCGNVHVNWLPPQPKHDKAFERRHGKLPSRRLGNIIITPMTRLLARTLNDPATDNATRRKLASHLCRGHFKRYTEDGKLFGRVTGTFFWTPQIRGDWNRDVERGEYKINLKGVKVRL